MDKNVYDIAIIGGGASGLSAAIASGRAYSCKIVVLEKLPRVGKKILATGNGRCNLGNINLSKERYYGDIENYSDILNKNNTIDFFSSLGVLCVEEEGRLYPYSQNANAVLDALRLEIERLGVEVKCDFSVKSCCFKNDLFYITSEDNQLVSAKRLIIAAGGCSSPSLGTDGSGARLAKSFGHKVVPQKPSLVAVKTEQALLKGLKGVRVNARVDFILQEKTLKSEFGEVQFGESTLSGICVFNLSRFADRGVTIVLDLMPDYSKKQVMEILQDLKNKRINATLEDYLTGIFNKRVGLSLLRKVTDKAFNEKVCSLSEKELLSIAEVIKRWEFPVLSSGGFQNSQVTSGGVTGAEIDGCLQSKRVKGLYLCGEVLNIDGDCGGYNLAFAWASGITAGEAAAMSLKGEK